MAMSLDITACKINRIKQSFHQKQKRFVLRFFKAVKKTKSSNNTPQFCNLLFFNVFHLEPDAPYIFKHDSKMGKRGTQNQQCLKCKRCGEEEIT